MDRTLDSLVRQRAGGRCEYCRIGPPYMIFHVDHIISRQHGGKTEPENLALACLHCNLHKGTNIAGLDPTTGDLVRLYNPRTDTWREHFRWDGPRLLGVTPIGRVTVDLLAINRSDFVEARERQISIGNLPPAE